MLRTIKAKVKSFLMAYPQTVTSTLTSSSVDLQQFGACMIEIAVGTMTFTTSNKISWKLQESSDDSSYADVADGDYLDAPAASPYYKVQNGTADSQTVFAIHYRGSKRYVKAIGTVAGTVSVGVCVTAVKAYPELQPPL